MKKEFFLFAYEYFSYEKKYNSDNRYEYYYCEEGQYIYVNWLMMTSVFYDCL